MMLRSLEGKELSENVPSGKDKSCPEVEEAMSLQQITTKVSRSGSSCSKRPRMSKSEKFSSLNKLEESRDASERLGSDHIKKKSQFPKQKSHSTKCGEKRNIKVASSTAKCGSSLKSGATIFVSAYGGKNLFGLYGLKHDIHDVTKLMDVPSLDGLLRGTFDCLSLSEDVRKKTSNTSGSIFDSVRKACSLLQLPKSVQSKNMDDIDSSLYKMSDSQMSLFSAVESNGIKDKEQSCTSDMSACHKDLCTENKNSSSLLDFPLYQPKDVLERIAVPRSQDLDSLFPDESKPVVPKKNSNNLRSGKQVSDQPSLPTFPWSHAFGSHSRTNSDIVKLSTSRSTCQGKWARIDLIASSTDISRGCFTNLDSFSYDQSLVPSTSSSSHKDCPSLFAILPFCQWNSSSSVTRPKDFEATTDGHCPRLLEAAEILCEMATNSPGHNPYEIMRSQKKTLHKNMKGKNLKPIANHEEMSSAPTSVVGSNLMARSVDEIIPAKKPRVSTVEYRNGVRSHYDKKGPYSSKSSMPLPSKPVRDLIKENKHSTATILKELTMMHPTNRILDKGKAYVSQFKVKKLGLVDWKRGKDK
ncbi:hypothetical protein VIGAN_10220800 [Vigna angularis var. angularis]|uniref:Uncharacterized protein n=1 Tax=Vigna angularis var. angularis TaxID=157739 RepID=A0A0S3T637_PHAAN|nr:uncharacterized protein LOC108320310 isoform X2 [Vigna angularis]BAU00599.1 hypothetical protein VIGAN_10220800 [Vigna angularis var. angularis]